MAIFIYGLVCPVTQKVRYVGKSIEPEKRLQAHIGGAKRGNYNHHTARWIRMLLERGLRPTMQIIVEVPEGTRWQDVERELIAKASANGWRLTNSTAGGEGLDYRDPEDAARYKSNLSQAMRRLWADKDRSEEMKARVLAIHANPESAVKRRISLQIAAKRPETKAKRTAAMKLINAQPDIKAKQAARFEAYWQDPEYRAKMHDEDARKKMSEKAKARWKDDPAKMAKSMNLPERKAKLSEAMSRRNAAPELRAKLLDPELIARRNASIKLSWDRRKAEKAAAQQE